jgi:hypothetical protein
MCLQEIRLLKPGEDAAPDLLHSSANIARNAEVTVSSTHPDYSASGAVDGVVGGYPDHIEHEWASRGERDTAMIRLTWSTPQTVNRVQLFDRPNDLDQVTSGMLVFSDGSTISTGALPDNAQQGLEISFAPKTVQWLIFAVNRTKPGTLNVGLSEIAVFSAKP